jgi:hypothetical protein
MIVTRQDHPGNREDDDVYDGTGGHGRPRRGRRWRAGRAGILVALAAGIALLAAGCGGGGSSDAGLTAYQKAVAYAQCMRAHGEPGYPDPTSNGGFIINGKTDNLNGALMGKANKACQHLLPPQKPLTPAQQRQITNEALKYVACMRTHGVPDMPDPTVNANGIGFRGPSGFGPNSPQFQSAMQACKKLLPGLPGGGP